MNYFKYLAIICSLGLFVVCSCQKDLQPSPPLTDQNDGTGNNNQGNDNQGDDNDQDDHDQDNNSQEHDDSLHLYADFESVTVELNPKHDTYNYATVNNPAPDEINSSTKCGKITLSADAWDFLYTSPLEGTFDFSGYTTFRIKIYSQAAGKVSFKLESSVRSADKIEIIHDITANDTNKWIELVCHFNLPDINAKGSDFDKFNILVNAEGDDHGAGKNFFIDDIYGPELK